MELERELGVLYISPERNRNSVAAQDDAPPPIVNNDAALPGSESETPKPAEVPPIETVEEAEDTNTAGAGLIQRLSIWCRERARELADTSLLLYLYDNVNIVDRVAEMVIGRKGEPCFQLSRRRCTVNFISRYPDQRYMRDDRQASQRLHGRPPNVQSQRILPQCW